MFETFAYETDRNRRGIAVFVVLVSLYSAFIVALFPSFENVDIDQLIEAYPEVVQQAFGIQAIGTVEGFLAAQVYTFIWVLLLGLYFAYQGGGLIAADIERDRMDLLLALPQSRAQLLLGKVASLGVSIVAVNLGVGAVIYGVVIAIGESIDVADLVMVHLLSIPYLLTCTAAGVVLSVVLDRADVARRVAIGLVFALYLVESVAASAAGFEFLQYISPTHYYKPTEILVNETIALTDAGILTVAFLVLLVGGLLLFKHRDI